MGRLTGKTAIITGGEGSIGMATARAFVTEGASVFLAGLSEPDLKAGAAELGEQAAWQVTDVTDSAHVKSAVDAALERFGHLDVVIANAGIKGATGPIADYPEDSFDQSLAVHVRGAFLLAKHAVPYLPRGGSIIFTSSVVGLTAAPHIAGYSTAKHAKDGLMRTIDAAVHPSEHHPPRPGEQRVPAHRRGGRHRSRPGDRRHDLRRHDPARPARGPGGDRADHALPRQRRQLVHDGRDASG
jgi:NAD(P)-dependent dehydrogenase (short-subunit alcohol dehydrogenase family)